MTDLTFPALVQAYCDSLRTKPSYARTVQIVDHWIGRLKEAPTRREVLARHARLNEGGCPTTGDKLRLSQSANKELSILRSLIRWGIYQERWNGANPTEGVKRWKTKKRKRVILYQEVSTLLHGMEFVGAGPLSSDPPHAEDLSPRMLARMAACEARDRALFGLLLFSGCRPSEAATARVDSIQRYGRMGRWCKPTTKTGEAQEIPLPWQAMAWLETYTHPSTGYLFPGQNGGPLTSRAIHKRWKKWRTELRFEGLWVYDFRRSLATYCTTVLKESDTTVQAILNHYDGRAIGHYSHHTFDTLVPIIQAYADWLCSLQSLTQEGDHVSPTVVHPVRISRDCVGAIG